MDDEEMRAAFAAFGKAISEALHLQWMVDVLARALARVVAWWESTR